MAFQRAQWHSGLTYQQTCECCKTVVQYTDYSLDFRPWYADGFVDCPTCKSHLRHNEKYALSTPDDQPKIVAVPMPESQDNVTMSTGDGADMNLEFCTSCGRKFGEDDCFCAKCGKKRG